MKLMIIIQNNTDNLIEKLKAVDGTADIIWFRVKNQNEKDIDFSAKIVRDNVKKSLLFLSPYLDTALKYNYDGLQLNKDVINNEKYLKNSLLKGYSAHSIEEINNIKADFYTFSPIFDTPKDYKVTPVGLQIMPKNKKVFALGGIKKEHEKILKEYGFYGMAGIRLINDFI